MRPTDWPSREAMQGNRAARINEAASILLIPRDQDSAVEAKPPRVCRGTILFTSVGDRRELAADMFERAGGKDLHCVLSHMAPEFPWAFHDFDVGHRGQGVITWYRDYCLWMRSDDDPAWLVPKTDGPSFLAATGELILHATPPYMDGRERRDGLRVASRALLRLFSGRN